MSQNELLDINLYEIIEHCSLRKKSPFVTEIVVTYTNGLKERIWTFNPNRYTFNVDEFIGKTKIEAVFHCDRKKSIRM